MTAVEHGLPRELDTSREAPRCDWSPGCYLGFFGPSAVLAVDAERYLMLAYNAGDSAGAPQRMWVRTSTDGVSWSARKKFRTARHQSTTLFPPWPPANRRRLPVGLAGRPQRKRGRLEHLVPTDTDGGAFWTERPGGGYPVAGRRTV